MTKSGKFSILMGFYGALGGLGGRGEGSRGGHCFVQNRKLRGVSIQSGTNDGNLREMR